MPLPFDLLPIEGGRIKVGVRLQKAQDVIDAALIDEVKNDPRVAWSNVKAKRGRGRRR